mgnify:CR=1 FL=1|tara:strand:- start:41102 stop:46369 length:5268 start_codon:yes stop_codon:yes gene_type:complete
MANKSKKVSTNKLLLVEPNADDSRLIPNEDLSIYVDLQTISKGRSIISVNDESGSITNNGGGKGKVIKFLDGSKSNTGRSLTTNYTEINSNFSVNGEDDLEALGIESIDIDFDTAYTPLIKIKFIDVRGQSVIQQGIDSKYRMFFEMPYPIFELTVKGYFGRPVKYCLHLTNWGSNFNSKTGNFEIKADFMGYTYALLTDMLLGLIRATVYTEKGSTIFEKIQDEFNVKDKDITLKTIDDFLNDVQNIKDEFSKLKDNDNEIKEINTINDIKVSLKSVKFIINELSLNLKPTDSPYFDDNNGIIGVNPSAVKKRDDGKTLLQSNKESIDEAKKVLNKTITDKINSKIENSDLQFDINKLKNINTITSLPVSTYQNYINSVNFNNIANSGGYSGDKEDYQELLDGIIQSVNNNVVDAPSNAKIIVYDLRECYKEVERVEKRLVKYEELNRDIVSKKLTNIATKKLDFEPTIKNIFRMLTVHCEVFLETLQSVSSEAESSSVRNSILKNKVNKLNSDNPDDNNIYPWPEYREKDKNGVYQETWIGKGLKTSEKEKIPEILFVEDLLSKLIKIARNDENIKASVINNLGGSNYYPVSPLDSDYNGTSVNPYKTALISEGVGTPKEAIRCLLLRGFLGLGVSNISQTPKTLSTIGKLEARNLFNIFKTEFTRKNAREIIKEIESLSKEDIIKLYGPRGNYSLSEKQERNILKEITIEGTKQYYKYEYILDRETNLQTNNFRTYIPVTNDFEGLNFHENLNENKRLKSIDDLKRLGNSTLFIGNNFGGLGNKTEDYDDGSKYFEILSETKYNSNNPTAPNTSGDIMTDYYKVIPKTTLVNSSTTLGAAYDKIRLSTLNPYSGRYNAQELFDLNFDDSTPKYKKDGANEGVASVTIGYFNEITESKGFNSDNFGGNYLARFKKGEDKNYDETDSYFCKGCGTPKYKTSNLNRRLSSTDLPSEFGKQREILGDLYGETKNDNNVDDIYTPFIDFGINDGNQILGSFCNYFSLFGSRFYYGQKSIEAKAFLFLNTFGWEGIIGEQIETDFYYFIDEGVSLFDGINTNSDGDSKSFRDKDETFLLKGLFGANASFIKAPKLWCAFIGSLLYRYQQGLNGDDIITFKDDNSDPLCAWQKSESRVPRHDEYIRSRANQNSSFGLLLDFNDDNEYPKVDEILLRLPKQIKDAFINSFTDFANKGDFKLLKDNLEIFNVTSLVGFDNLWGEINSLKEEFTFPNGIQKSYKISKSGIQTLIDEGKLNSHVLDSYSDISPLSEYPWNKNNDVGSNIYQINLKLKPTAKGNKILNNLLKANNVILNNNPKAFNSRVTTTSGVGYEDIIVPKVEFDLFLDNFCNEFKSLAKKWRSGEDNETSDLENKLFKSVDNDAIKLNLYRTLSSIYNKWLGDSKSIFGQCGVSSYDTKIAKKERNSEPRLIDSFRFLDRAFTSIGDEFYINPLAVSDLIVNNYNQSFFDLSNRVLSDNNFNFIALPSFVNFNNVDDVADMFKPYTYNDLANNDGKLEVGPSFVCTYIGQTSTNLNMGNSYQHPDDGVYIRYANGNPDGAPVDFLNQKIGDGDLNIPMIAVSYGRDNQSFFKDIKLDQREFSETAESLQIIEDISKDANKRSPSYVGQNLFNVYQKRSYSTEIEMMGNAMVQPMMYFHLNDIPLFRGAYMITKVTHSIKAHNMTTKMKGVRVKAGKTPLVDAPTLFMDLLGPLDGGGSAEKVGGTKSNEGTRKDFKIIPSNSDDNGDDNDNGINGIIIEL